jgi:hypothetical protein
MAKKGPKEIAMALRELSHLHSTDHRSSLPVRGRECPSHRKYEAANLPEFFAPAWLLLLSCRG